MIQFVQVSKAFGTQQVINDVTFTVNPGERVGLVGPNGAGKSTLFEMLAGGLPPDKGEVVRPSSLRLGYVRQQLYGLGEGASLLDYVENAIPELNVLHAEMEQLEARLPEVDAEERGDGGRDVDVPRVRRRPARRDAGARQRERKIAQPVHRDDDGELDQERQHQAGPVEAE